MKKLSILLFACLLAFSSASACSACLAKSFFGQKATTLDGKEVKLYDYFNHFILVVNVPTDGSGKKQLKQLEELYKEYGEKEDFIVLLFHCDQFGVKKSKDNSTLETLYREKLGLTFPIFSTVEIKESETQHAAYNILFNQKRGEISESFTKVLLNPVGIIMKMYPPKTKLKDMKASIEEEFKKY